MKVKTFLKEHKKEIIGVAIGTGCVVAITLAGYSIGKTCTMKHFGKILNIHDVAVLQDATKKGVDSGFAWISEEAIAPENLGRLGEQMIKCGGQNAKFTHFLAYGKE